jgi:hypothetical protein
LGGGLYRYGATGIILIITNKGTKMENYNNRVAREMLRKMSIRKNGLESARGLTGQERKELARLTDLEGYLLAAIEKPEGKMSLAERCRKVLES